MGAPLIPKLSLAELNFVILILASGRGERFIASGGKTHKLDAPFSSDMTVLEATFHKASQTGLRVHLERGQHAGMGDTIAAAVAATQDADGWLMLPADMPLVPTSVMLAVAAELCDSPIAAPQFQGKRGHPVGFSKACVQDLLNLTGDQGARALFQNFLAKTIDVEALPGAQGCLLDIDTMQDLERLQKHGILG
jgi:molybdenum cofactor cytidylyltransferase